MWIKIDEDYLQYMKTHGDNRIPNQYYGTGKYKPFFKLFTQGDISYVTQINHAQGRHNHMREMPDFFKLYQGSELVGVVNLNYMFPVLEKHIQEMSEQNIKDVLLLAKTEEQTSRYMDKLAAEKTAIIDKDIGLHAQLLYEQQIGGRLDRKLFERCLNYMDLEKTTIQNELEHVFTTEQTHIVAIEGLFFVDVDEERYTVTYNDINSLPLLKEVHENGLEIAKDLEITTDNSKTL